MVLFIYISSSILNLFTYIFDNAYFYVCRVMKEIK